MSKLVAFVAGVGAGLTLYELVVRAKTGRKLWELLPEGDLIWGPWAMDDLSTDDPWRYGTDPEYWRGR